MLASDSSGNGNTGNIIGATWTTDSKTGRYALKFNGLNEYVNTTIDENLGNDFSFGAWIKADSSNPNGQIPIGVIAEKGTYDPLIEIVLDLPDFGDATSYIRDGQTQNVENVSADNAYSVGSWQHVFLVRDSQQDRLYIYLNGVGNNIYDGTFDSFQISGYPLYIGARNTRGIANTFFNGTIDDVIVYNRSLSSEEVLEIYRESSNYHPSDTNSNGCVDTDEVIAFIDRWKLSVADVNMPEMMESIGLWKSGVGC
jgi:arabinan endo-1,5-alpha-L-arabinosidase